MRPMHLALVIAAAACAVPLGAEAREGARRDPPSQAQVDHARRMVRALDDYDAQIARRMRQLKAEQRRYRRMGH